MPMGVVVGYACRHGGAGCGVHTTIERVWVCVRTTSERVVLDDY